MVTINVRIPDKIHEQLVSYKSDKKPHISLNAIIVEALAKSLEESERKAK